MSDVISIKEGGKSVHEILARYQLNPDEPILQQQQHKGHADVWANVKIWFVHFASNRHKIYQMRTSHADLSSSSTGLDFRNIWHSLRCIWNNRYQPRFTRCLGRLPKVQRC